MMYVPEYAQKAISKIGLYEKNGIYIGENLIVTFETEKNILSTKQIEKLINRYII